MKSGYLSEMVIDVRPYPWYERFRVGLTCLFLGRVRFRGQLADLKCGRVGDTSPRVD